MRLAVLALVAGLAFSAFPAVAGDYYLLVRRDPRACRDRYATVRATPREVVADLGVVFQGGEPKIPALRAMVANAAIDFCTAADLGAFERGLVALGTRARIAEEQHYRDFVLMFSNRSLIAELDAQLRRKDLAPAARARLAVLRKEAWGRFRFKYRYSEGAEQR